MTSPGPSPCRELNELSVLHSPIITLASETLSDFKDQRVTAILRADTPVDMNIDSLIRPDTQGNGAEVVTYPRRNVEREYKLGTRKSGDPSTYVNSLAQSCEVSLCPKLKIPRRIFGGDPFIKVIQGYSVEHLMCIDNIDSEGNSIDPIEQTTRISGSYCPFCEKMSNLFTIQKGMWVTLCNTCGEVLRYLPIKGLKGGAPVYSIQSCEGDEKVMREVVIDFHLDFKDPDEVYDIVEEFIKINMPLRSGAAMNVNDYQFRFDKHTPALHYEYDFKHIEVPPGEDYIDVNALLDCCICQEKCIGNNLLNCFHPVHIQCMATYCITRLDDQPLATIIHCPLCRADHNIYELFPYLEPNQQEIQDLHDFDDFAVEGMVFEQANIVVLPDEIPEDLINEPNQIAPLAEEDEDDQHFDHEVRYYGFREDVIDPHLVIVRRGSPWFYYQYVDHLRTIYENLLWFNIDVGIYYNPVAISLWSFVIALPADIFVQITRNDVLITFRLLFIKYVFWWFYILLFPLNTVKRLISYIIDRYNYYFPVPFRFVLGYQRDFDDYLGEDIPRPNMVQPALFNAEHIGQNGLIGQENRRIRVLYWEQFPFPKLFGMFNRTPVVHGVGDDVNFLRIMIDQQNCQFPKGLVDQIIGHFPRMEYDDRLINYRLTEHYCMGITRQMDITPDREMHCNLYAPAVAYLTAWNRRVDMNEVLLNRYSTLKIPTVRIIYMLSMVLYLYTLYYFIMSYLRDYYPDRIGFNYIGMPTVNNILNYNLDNIYELYIKKLTFVESIKFQILRPLNYFLYNFSFNKIVVDCNYWNLNGFIFQCRFQNKFYKQILTMLLPDFRTTSLFLTGLLFHIQGPLTFFAVFGALIEEGVRNSIPQEYLPLFAVVGAYEVYKSSNAWHFYLHLIMIYLHSVDPIYCLIFHLLVNTFTTVHCSLLEVFAEEIDVCIQFVVYLAQTIIYPLYFIFVAFFAAGIVKLLVGLVIVALTL